MQVINNFIKMKKSTIKIRTLLPDKMINNDITLLILHEGLGSIGQWKQFPENLANALGLKTLLYDRFGHGESARFIEKRGKNYLEKEAFEILPEVLKKTGTGRVFIVGHSDGATIALLYASRFGDNTAGVVSEAAHVLVEPVTLQGLIKAREAYENNPKFRERLFRYHGDKTDELFYAWNNIWRDENFADWNVEHYLKNIRCPVLVIQGEQDEYGSEKQVEAIINGVSGDKEQYMIPDCKHIPHLEKEKEVIECINNFFLTMLKNRYGSP